MVGSNTTDTNRSHARHPALRAGALVAVDRVVGHTSAAVAPAHPPGDGAPRYRRPARRAAPTWGRSRLSGAGWERRTPGITPGRSLFGLFVPSADQLVRAKRSLEQ